MMSGGGGWWMAMGWFVLVVFAALVMFLALGRPDRPHRRSTPSDAAEILAERFARGEIDEAEYRARSDALRR